MADGFEPAPSTFRRWVPKVLIPLIIVGCIAGFVAAGLLAQTEPDPIDSANGLEAIIPLRNTKVLRQDVVGVDLAVGYQGRLKINDIEIPTEQLVQDNGLNQVLFAPGKGKVIVELLANRNCATITYWRQQDGPEGAGPPLKWCFDAL